MKNSVIYLLTIAMVVCAGCDRRKITRTDTPTSGQATIMADECFAPIVTEEVDVFTALNIEAEITPVFLGETDVFDLLLKDSIRLAIAARDLTPHEKDIIRANKLTPRTQQIATDGVALIIHKSNTDSLMSIQTLREIMTGRIDDWNAFVGEPAAAARPLTVVFDKANSSTVRYVADSICHGEAISSKIYAAESNRAVIEYVSNHPGSIGVIGVNWISNPHDPMHLSFDEKIRVMSVSRDLHPTPDNSYKPFPAYLATRDYPMVRQIYAILTDLRGTLPAGFVSFIAGESGQRIVLKAGLVPATAPIRLVNVTE